jgi:hypothetical protein
MTFRPFFDVNTSKLVSFCKHEKLEFVENEKLPSKELAELCTFHQNILELSSDAFEQIDLILQKSANFKSELGCCYLQINPNSLEKKDRWIHDPFIAQIVLKKILRWVWQKQEPSLHLIESCRKHIIQKSGTMKALSGISLSPPVKKIHQNTWIFGRQPFFQQERATRVPLAIDSPTFWDKRYSITMSSKSRSAIKFLDDELSDTEVAKTSGLSIRPFLEADLALIKQDRSKRPFHRQIISCLKLMPVNCKETLPCVIKDSTGEILSLPTLKIDFSRQSNANAVFHHDITKDFK